MLHFSVKKKKKLNLPIVYLFKSSVYFVNKIWDLTNSNDMQFFSDILLKKKVSC